MWVVGARRMVRSNQLAVAREFLEIQQQKWATINKIYCQHVSENTSLHE